MNQSLPEVALTIEHVFEKKTPWSTISESEEETKRLGYDFSGQLAQGDLIAFFGEIGSGKTTFIRGVCSGLGCAEQVTSPSFTLINVYDGTIPVYHFDFYRIETSDELGQLGLDEYFEGNGVCLIEWSERVLDFLPAKRTEIRLENLFKTGNPDQRKIQISVK